MNEYCRRHGRGNPIVIKPRFLPRGFRFLEPNEEVEKGDWYWSHTHKCYLRVTTNRAQLAEETVPFIRRK